MKLVSYLHITILLSLLALISSCTDEDIVKSYNIKEGVPVTVSLKYNVAQSTVETRSAQDARWSRRYSDCLSLLSSKTGIYRERLMCHQSIILRVLVL